MQYFPKNITKQLAVEVYLPKNLLNYGKLIELLSKTLEYHEAHKWMLDNYKDVFDRENLVFEIDIHLQKEVETLKGIRRIFELHSIILPENISLFKLGDISLIKENGNLLFYFKAEEKEIGFHKLFYKRTYSKDQILKTKSGRFLSVKHIGWIVGDKTIFTKLISKKKEQNDELEEYKNAKKGFRNAIRNMDRTIKGYSVYEVDGAFKNGDHCELIPTVQEFFLKGEEKDNMKNALEQEEEDNIRKTFTKYGCFLKDIIFELPESYKELFEKGTLSRLIRSAFYIKGYSLSKNSKIIEKDKKFCVINDKKNNRLYEVYYSSPFLTVYKTKIEIVKKNELWEINVGELSFRIRERDNYFEIARCIKLIEERTLVIRFITNIQREENNMIDGENTDINNANHKLVWDTLSLIGHYFVYKLGQVGVEDEIWITFDTCDQWIWKKGRVLKQDYLN